MPGGVRISQYDTGERVKFNKTLYKKLMRFAAPWWHYLLISLVLILIYTFADIYKPILEARAIDVFMAGALDGSLTQAEALDGIKTMAILYGCLILGQFVIGYFREYILRITGQKIIKRIRKVLFEKVQHLPLSYFDKNPDGVVVTRINNDPQALNELFTNVIVGFAQNILIMIGVLIAMFISNVNMALCSVAVLPIIAVITVIIQKVARKIFLTIRHKLAKINAFLDENISGIKIIRAFTMEMKKMKDFKALNEEYFQANMKMVVFFGILRPLLDFVRYLALAILLYYGSFNILNGAISIGILYLFVKYINMFFDPMMAIADQFNTLQSSLAAGEKVFTILEKDSEPEPENPNKLPPKGMGKVEFKNVWFAYIDETWVLKDVSFVVEAGKSAAFVGATGAGKTSIISLLCGFYEIQKGTIYLDDIDISTISKKELRNRMGLVLQDVFLMAGDIKTNIRLFGSDKTDEDVVEIAKYLQADDFIQRLPDKYNHKLSSEGSTLSSGERQLLSFARALCQDPDVLIMDEATANIDTHTEKLVQESLDKLQKGRTSIAIAHRLSTIKNADEIIVIHQGEIVERGDHEMLMANGSIYYDLVQLQQRN